MSKLDYTLDAESFEDKAFIRAYRARITTEDKLDLIKSMERNREVSINDSKLGNATQAMVQPFPQIEFYQEHSSQPILASSVRRRARSA